jgi:hypothetical protein
MILAVFILSDYFDNADREDELFLIPMFQDISEFYINMGFMPLLRRKRLTGKVVREIWKGEEYNIQNYTVILDGDSVEIKNILNHCNGDLDILREGLTMIMNRAGSGSSITSTGFSISSGYLVEI